MLSMVDGKCFRSSNEVDVNCPQNIANAWAANMSYVAAYIFPCSTCGGGASQAQKTIDYLSNANSTIGQIWLDIEGPGTYWGSDTGANQQFFLDMANTILSNNISVVVYTSASQWEPIMGDNFTGGSDFPLWYAHYDDNPSFSDFSPFANWMVPVIKQYTDSGSDCGFSGLDVDWTPDM
eukprot:TRINITY_DN8594_c0_g1_i1.p1 TRINITY_DN8594_c0_g1~~TRINITY_DN8594_c0_g1_i1.p1  ORF type:complete len:179 (+),score=30.66 TRINITY_DN8594_c0_g1_i1:112-648(+)